MAAREEPLLESWKEISAYLKRSVRTCKRWESALDLPIHRLDGTPKARVFAYPAELDRWLREKLHHIEDEEGVGRKRRTLSVPGRRWLSLGIGAGALAIALGGTAVFVLPVLKPVPAPVPGALPMVAIVPFENPSGDRDLEDWRIALPELLMTDLRQSRYLNVVPSRQMYARLKEMKLAESSTLAADDLAAMAKRFGQDFTATGRLEKAGDEIDIEILLRNEKAPAEPPRALRMKVRGEKAMIARADVLSREIKEAVGLSRRMIAADIDLPLDRISTASPEALRLYVRAGWPSEWGILPDTGPALEKALAIDPGFASAHALLYAAYEATRVEEKLGCYAKAMSLAERMSEREFLLLQASFYHFLHAQDGFAKVGGAGIPIETFDRLKPKTRAEALPVFERLAALYPDFRGSQSVLTDLVNIYMQTEEWEKAIAVLEPIAALTAERGSANVQMLIRCYLARGETDKAEAALAMIAKKGDPRAVDSSRTQIALRKRLFDEYHASLDRAHAEPGPKGRPYIYYTGRGYALWLADDLAQAEESYRAAIPEAGPEVEAQRAVDLVALSLSQGRLVQAMAEAERGLAITEKVPALARRGAPRRFHQLKALLYRLSGRMPEALREAEAACRGYEREVAPGWAVDLLSLRGLILLESGPTADFERVLEEIGDYCVREACPKLMRAYHYLRGRQEFAQGHAQKALTELSRALDLSAPPTSQSDPSAILSAIAEVHESMGDPISAGMQYREIGKLVERGSFCGDVYALSFYRAAKCEHDRWGQSLWRTKDVSAGVIEGYRKFLTLWGGAEPPFAGYVQDARKRLASLGAE
jgi:tetratricopeptide (TPR) repeat protein